MDEEELIEEGNENEEFFVRVRKWDDEGIIKIFKEDGKWKEKNVEGDLGGDKTYMGYLKVEDILEWLNDDFDDVEIIDKAEVEE